MTYLDQRRKPAPFLKIAQPAIESLQREQARHRHSKQSFLDSDSLMTLYTTLANSSSFIENGRRLENLSWRVVNRSVLSKDQVTYDDCEALLRISTDSLASQRTRFQKEVERVKREREARARREREAERIRQQKEAERIQQEQAKQAKQKQEQARQDQLKQRPMNSLFAQHPTLFPSSARVSTREITTEISESDSDSSHKENSNTSNKQTAPDLPSLFPRQQVPRKDSLFASHQQPQPIIFSSDDDDDDSLDDSDWSSVSDDSDYEREPEPPRDDTMFRKQLVRRPSEAHSTLSEQMGHRSGLSGIFQPAKKAATVTAVSSEDHSISPKLVYSTGPTHGGSVLHTDQPLDLSTRMAEKAAASATAVNMTTKATFSPSDNPRELLKRHASHKDEAPSSLVSKSGLSLASFFSNSRKPHPTSPSGTPHDRFHQSNAPATAQTLLPTALATHMFLPTMSLRQQVRARYREPNNLKIAAMRRSSGTTSGTTSGSGTLGQRSGSVNGQRNGSVNGSVNGSINGHRNGSVNGSTNGVDHTNTNSYNNNRHQSIHRYSSIDEAGEPTHQQSPGSEEYSSSIKTGTSSIDIPGRRAAYNNYYDSRRSSTTSLHSSHLGTLDRADTKAEDSMVLEFQTRRAQQQQQQKKTQDLFIDEDGYVDDRMIDVKVRTNAPPGTQDDWDNDTMDYHAKGW